MPEDGLRAVRQAVLDAHAAADSASDPTGALPRFHRPRYAGVPTGGRPVTFGTHPLRLGRTFGRSLRRR